MLATVAVEALARLRESVDALLDADLTSADGLELTGLLGELEVQRRRLDAVAVAVDSAAEQRRVAGEFAEAALTDLLAARLRVDGRDARARSERAALLGSRFALSGESLTPILPLAAAALAGGQISAAHVDVIARYTGKVDGLDGAGLDAGLGAGLDAVAAAEQLLVDASRVEPPRRVAQLGELLLARLDPDGAEPRDELAQRRRGFSLVDNPDGSVCPRGRWTAELAAAWRALLDTLAAPQPADESGEHDPRSAAQRRHDGMLEAAMRLLNGGLGSGGTPVTLMVRVTTDHLAEGAGNVPGGILDPTRYAWDGDADVLAAVHAGLAGSGHSSDSGDAREIDGGNGNVDGNGDANANGDGDGSGSGSGGGGSGGGGAPAPGRGWGDTLGRTALFGYGLESHGALVSLSALSAGLCQAETAVVVTAPYGGVLAYGRSRRLADRKQHTVLGERDGGCSFPACTRPPAWCEVHHVIPWQRGGRTDLHNLCLLCVYHHRNFERLGWTVHMRDGLPEWIPPRWIDPEQRPRRNTAHHLPDYDFGAFTMPIRHA